jgi:hypothetical protein
MRFDQRDVGATLVVARDRAGTRPAPTTFNQPQCLAMVFHLGIMGSFQEAEAEMTDWKSTCNSFVAFLDIMGFKDMMFRNSHAYVMKKMNAIRLTTKMIERDGKETLAKRRKEGKDSHTAIILPVVFSDSILLVSEDDSESSARDILFEAAYLLHDSFHEGIPIKGALAYGEQTADFKESLHFGKPLIDAYELQSELQMYGLVLHHSMEAYLKKHNILFNDRLLSLYETPLKGGKVNHYCINTNFLEETALVPVISEMYNSVSGNTRLYVDNTIDFVNSTKLNIPKK